MAKQKRLLPARKPPEQSRSEQALSIRSAESLGRVIGTLQRQLDSVVHRFTGRPVHRPKAANAEPAHKQPDARRKRARPSRPAAADAPAPRRTTSSYEKTTGASRARAAGTTRAGSTTNARARATTTARTRATKTGARAGAGTKAAIKRAARPK